MIQEVDFLSDEMYAHLPDIFVPPVPAAELAAHEARRQVALAALGPPMGAVLCRRAANKMDRAILRHERAAMDLSAKPVTDRRQASIVNHTTIAKRLTKVQQTLRVLAHMHEHKTITERLRVIHTRAHVETALMLRNRELTAIYDGLPNQED